MADPPHPGEFVRTEIIEPRDLTVVEAAAALGVSRPALSAFLNGRSDLSGAMALRIEKAFGVRMETLMRMQTSYDVARMRRRQDEVSVEPYDAPRPREGRSGLPSVRERGTPYEETTLNIDDSVMRRLRDEAARRKTTMSELVAAGLRRVMAEPVPADVGPALAPLPSWHGGRHLVDISDRDALYRVMEEE